MSSRFSNCKLQGQLLDFSSFGLSLLCNIFHLHVYQFLPSLQGAAAAKSPCRPGKQVCQPSSAELNAPPCFQRPQHTCTILLHLGTIQ